MTVSNITKFKICDITLKMTDILTTIKKLNLFFFNLNTLYISFWLGFGFVESVFVISIFLPKTTLPTVDMGRCN